MRKRNFFPKLLNSILNKKFIFIIISKNFLLQIENNLFHSTIFEIIQCGEKFFSSKKEYIFLNVEYFILKVQLRSILLFYFYFEFYFHIHFKRFFYFYFHSERFLWFHFYFNRFLFSLFYIFPFIFNLTDFYFS